MKVPVGRLLSISLCAFTFLILVGCNADITFIKPKQDEAKKKKVIGLSLYYRQDEYYRDTEASFIEEAKIRGYEIIVQDANGDLYKQVQQLEDFVSTKVDLILMTAVEPSKIIQTVEHINKSGIPIFAYDEPPKGGELVSTILWDNYQAGIMIGEWAKNYIKTNLGGEANIAILDLPSQHLCMERVRGFKDAIDEMAGVKIIYQDDCKADRSYSMSITEKLIHADESINLIFGVTDDAAFGAVAAIEALKKDIVVICGGSWSVEAMKTLARSSRCYKANVTVNPYEQANTTFDAIDLFFNGGKLEDKYYISMKVYDKNNINELNWKAIEDRRSR